MGLLGNEPGAVDGRRLPSNASLHLSGTKEELDKRLTVYKRMAEKLMERRKRRDERGEAGEAAAEREKTIFSKNLGIFLNSLEFCFI